MNRDPFFEDIHARLAGPLDDAVFEACANDLLRKEYPTLVAIPGGDDSGMDGAIADGQGEPFPLVVTTSLDVIGNLTRNLKTYLEEGKPRRKSVLATSQALTQRKRSNLYHRAQELGFELIQIHDRTWFSQALYRDPDWCKALLNLTGRPRALSYVPLHTRPPLVTELVGREDDLRWLLETLGDRLLAGQPGSGKTFLLEKVATAANGRFVVNEDIEAIAQDIRREQPKIIIVDDAHMKLDLLKTLRHLRNEVHAEFDLVASTWEADWESVASEMLIGSSHTSILRPLRIDQISKIVLSTGQSFNPWVLQEIVNQASGRPGLAVFLTHLCSIGDTSRVVSGDVLASAILSPYDQLATRKIRTILGAFSVGGTSGLPQQVVASELGIPLIDLPTILTPLSGSGVLWETSSNAIAIHPPALRYTLIRDVFFSGPQKLPSEVVEQLLAQAPSLPQALISLIGAKARGANIPYSILPGYLPSVVDPEVFETYAYLGHSEAVWVLENHPEQFLAAARATLVHAPERTIPLLLQRAVGDTRPLNAHPLRQLEEWIQQALPGTPAVTIRRESLLREAERWLNKAEDTFVGLCALRACMSPRFERLVPNPGELHSSTLHFGYLVETELKALASWLPRIDDILSKTSIYDWRPLIDIAREWAHPRDVSDEIRTIMLDFAKNFASVVAAHAPQHEGVIRALKGFEELGLESELSDFVILYPIEDMTNPGQYAESQIAAVRRLASDWSNNDPEVVVQRIAHIEQEARASDIRYPRLTDVLCREIASLTTDPHVWLTLSVDASLPPDIVFSFLNELERRSDPRWVEIALLLVREEAYQGSVIGFVLEHPSPPPNLLNDALSRLTGFQELVRIKCLRGITTSQVNERLLSHTDERVRWAAAIGLWHYYRKSEMAITLKSVWQQAVLSISSDADSSDFYLAEILTQNPELAFDWLLRQVKQNNDPFWVTYMDRSMPKAVGQLNDEQRGLLLTQLENCRMCDSLVELLVGDSLAVYTILLNDPTLSGYHLSPLCDDNLDEAWIEKAKLAMDRGYSAQEIASSLLCPNRIITWSGRESDHWRQIRNKYVKLESHEDLGIRSIAENGIQYCEAHMNRALKHERDEDVYGLY